uniref:Uncharacterized protein n=1 Tax=Arundo donax TaxID=35708 RepID=A0A0A9D7U0_ARUDO
MLLGFRIRLSVFAPSADPAGRPRQMHVCPPIFSLIMAQFQKVGAKVYGNTPHNIYQRPCNPVVHESSVHVSPTNIWHTTSTSPCTEAHCSSLY